jgi:N-acetylglucosaminyldiphosphoundecaprenol N-acetyl-beta-D-mannosaminyltransferase
MTTNPPPPSTRRVLNTDLACTDYDGLGDFLKCRASTKGLPNFAVDFTNTHIATMRRHDRKFGETTSCIDLFVPDGMPLIWCLNAQGAQLKDRVYGPTFMGKFLAKCPGHFTHYFLGGNGDCLAGLRKNLLERNPSLNIAGMKNGYFREAEPLVEEIAEKRPDFLWIGLGTPKQQEFIHRWKKSLASKVILAVGFAFDVNAGTKGDAPLWMQKNGLTWVYRLATEPRRLAVRYLKWNSLFLYYLLKR